MTSLQYDGPGDSLGLVEASIEPGAYTGSDLALAFEASMNASLTPTSGSVTVVYSNLTRKLEFTFDNIYSYYYARRINSTTLTVQDSLFFGHIHQVQVVLLYSHRIS